MNQKRTNDTLEVFKFFFAASLIFQYLSNYSLAKSLVEQGGGLWGIIEVIVFLSSLIILFRPSAKLPLLTCALGVIADTIIASPWLPNHRVITFCSSVSILLWLITSRNEEKSDGRLENAIKLQVIILYLAATFHKLNSGFLDPVSSCANAFYLHVVDVVPFLPVSGIFRDALPYFVILTEGALPILLFVPKTRRWGVMLGLLFHFALALDVQKHFLDFSSVMYSGLILFVSTGTAKRLRTDLIGQFRIVRGFAIVAGATLLCEFLYQYGPFLQLWWNLRQALWMVSAVFVIWIVFRSIVNDEREEEPKIGLPGRALLLVPILMVINAATPYLGIKTRSSFDMYSNLVIDPPTTNHLILRQSLDLLHLMEKPVEVIETTNEELKKVQENGQVLPISALRGAIRRDPLKSVRYRRGGGEFSYEPGSIEGEAFLKEGEITDKIFWFRPIDRRVPAACQW